MFFGRLKMQFATLPAVTFLTLVTFVAGAVFTAPAAGQVAAEPSTVTEPSVPSTVTETAHKTHVVTMSHKFSYEPKTLVVNVGDTVVWKDTDIYQHTVTAVNRKSFDSGPINPGKSWRYKAVKPGTYDYFCVPHPNMKGKLIVQ